MYLVETIIGRLARWSFTFVGYLISGIITLAFFAAVVAFVYRSYVFLKYGKWPASLCDLSNDVYARGGNIPNFCETLQTNLVGLNKILNIITIDYDASLVLIGISIFTMLVFFLFLGILSIALRQVIR